MAYRLPHWILLLRLWLCGLLLLCPGAAQPGPAVKDGKPPPPGRVRGRVVYADTGHPARRVAVSLVRLNEAEPNEAGPNPPIAITNLSGDFTIDAVPPGRYAAVVQGWDLVDFEAREEAAGADTKPRAEMFDGWFPVLTVKSGATAEVKVSVRRGGVIAGRVTNADGTPVAEAQLALLRRTKDGKLAPVSQRHTDYTADAQGYYRIPGLPSGTYYVRATDRDLHVSESNKQPFMRNAGRLFYAFHPTGRQAQEAVPVKVQEGVETPDIDIVLPDVPAYAVSGAVTFKGVPVTGAAVSVQYQDAETDLAGNEINSLTNDAGQWQIYGLPDGDYQLTVGLDNAHLATDTGKERSVNALELEQKVKIAGADVPALKLELASGGRIAGTAEIVAGEKKQGRVNLYLYQVNEKDDSTRHVDGAWDYFDAPGGFEINRLKPGSYRIYISGDEFYPQALLRQERDISDEPLKLAAGTEINDLRLVLASDFVAVTGRVWADGPPRRPLAAGRVIACPVVLKKVWESKYYTEKVDEQGRFKLQLPPGEYDLGVALLERRYLGSSHQS